MPPRPAADRIVPRLSTLVLAVAVTSAPPAIGEDIHRAMREFADRWVSCTSGGGDIAGFFREDAILAFEARGRNRTASPGDYAKLLADARSRMASFERRRQEIDVEPGEGGRGPSLAFTVIDRIGDSQGFTVLVECREEFDFAPGDLARAVRYRSEVLDCETVEKPEEWRTYGGPHGLNGFLFEADFYTAPKGMGLWLAGGAVVIVLVLMALHALGIKRRL